MGIPIEGEIEIGPSLKACVSDMVDVVGDIGGLLSLHDNRSQTDSLERKDCWSWRLRMLSSSTLWDSEKILGELAVTQPACRRNRTSKISVHQNATLTVKPMLEAP